MFLPPSDPFLDLWIADSAELGAIPAGAAGLLDESDRAELARRGYRERRSFLLARVVLRLALSRRTGRDASGWHFITDDLGRPGLDEESDLQFSITHAGELVVVAVANTLVGIDVEGEGADFESAASCLSPEELSRLRTLPEGVSSREFLSLWTAKEAYCKLTGQGTNRELAEITLDEISRHSHATTLGLAAGGEHFQLTALTARASGVPAVQTHFLSRGSLNLVGAVSARIPWRPTPRPAAARGSLRSSAS